GETAALGAVGPGGYFAGLVVQAVADAVAREVADQRIALLAGECPYGLADVADRRAAAYRPDAGPHRPLAVPAQSLELRRGLAHQVGRAGVGEDAVLHRRDIDIDEIALRQHALARDAVGDLLVH